MVEIVAIVIGPRAASITAGGAGMFCGSCMRDNDLARELHRRGVPIVQIPTFTPIRAEVEDASVDRVFLGGINVYLEQRWPVLGRLPASLRRLLDRPALLRGLSRLALQTRREEDGRVALSLLRGEHGRQAPELEQLINFLEREIQPEIVQLTNLLIAGFVPLLKKRLQVPVVVTLQGDDIFLDSLLEEDRAAVLGEMRRLARQVDAFVTFSEDYRARMARLFEIPAERIHVVPLGLADPEAFYRGPPRTTGPTLGYLARICPEKGFHQLVEAFLQLRERPGLEDLRLSYGGWLGASDRTFFEGLERRLTETVGAGAFEHVDLPDRESKIRFLHGIDVFSVPTVYQEPKGLSVLEALAAGRPVVQPAHGAFPEVLGHTGGARLVTPGDTEELASVLAELFRDEEQRRRLGEAGRAGVAERHSVEVMAEETLKVWSSVMGHGELGLDGDPSRISAR